jgi:glutathione S-transferase
MVKLYGSIMSSANRCHVMLKELGIEWEEAPLDMGQGEHKSPEFLKLNPNGKVPCLVDGDFVLWESMAINKYLAKKYKPEMLGGSIEAMARIDQWSYWSILHVQRYLFEMFSDSSKETRTRCTATLLPFHQVLDAHLEGREYILGDTFSLADINVGTVIAVNRFVKNDISEFSNIGAWLSLLFARPCFQS